MEIIEIGALKADDDLRQVAEFSALIKPVKHPVLTDFCTSLTGITNEELSKSASGRVVVYTRFREWIETTAESIPEWWGSWGLFDKSMFDSDAKAFNLSNPVGDLRHINIKQAHADFLHKEPTEIEPSLAELGLEFEGRQHRAFDDTSNILRIMQHTDGFFEYLKRQSV